MPSMAYKPMCVHLSMSVILLNGVSGIGINETTKINIVMAMTIGNLRNNESILFIILYYFTAKITIFWHSSSVSTE
jgi:hypothetical protein